MRNTLIALALGAGSALPAAAQWPAPVERALSPAYNACMDSGEAARGVNYAMLDCSRAEHDRQDARLNQAYRMTMQRLTPVRKARLRADERAWLARRERICTAAAKRFEGGTGAPLERSQCFLRETIARRLWLERYR